MHILFQANTKNVTHSKLPLFSLEYIGICAYIFLVNLSMMYLPGGGFTKQGDSNRRPLSVRPLKRHYTSTSIPWTMDQISIIKTPNPKCRLYWYLIEFLDWTYNQSCWYFRPLLRTRAPLTFSLIHLSPPLPFPLWISTGLHVFIQCVTGGGGDRGLQTEKHLPPSTFTGQFLRKADI